MAARKAPAKLDPELERLINSAAADTKTVEAVLRLRQDPTEIAANAEGAEAQVEEVLKRVREKAGTAAKQVNVFKNLGMFVVEAQPSFLRELVAQPEIASAIANQQPGEATTQPPVTNKKSAVRKKAGSPKGAGRRAKPRAAKDRKYKQPN